MINLATWQYGISILAAIDCNGPPLRTGISTKGGSVSIKPPFLAVLLVLSACSASPVNKFPGVFPDDYEVLVKTWLRFNLRDPDSVKELEITKPTRATAWTGLLGGGSVEAWKSCVSYNAKNGFGGYVGLRDYTFYFKSGQILIGNNGQFILDGCA